MELYPLKVFLTVATEKSFSRAGEKLLRTQPAISLAIQRLESELQEKLIDRSGKDLLLTAHKPGTYDLLLSTCFTVWLKAQPEEHMARVVAQGDTRPMAGNTEAMDDLRRILDGRAVLYGQAGNAAMMVNGYLKDGRDGAAYGQLALPGPRPVPESAAALICSNACSSCL